MRHLQKMVVRGDLNNVTKLDPRSLEVTNNHLKGHESPSEKGHKELPVISTASHELAKWLKRTYLKEALPIYSPRLFGYNHFLFSMFIQCECAFLHPLRALLRETKIGPDHTAGYSWGGTWPGG